MDLYIAVKNPNKTQGWGWEHALTGRITRYRVKDFGASKIIALDYHYGDSRGLLVLLANKITSVIKESRGIAIEGFTGGLFLKQSNIIKFNGLKYRLRVYGNLGTKIKNEIERMLDIFA